VGLHDLLVVYAVTGDMPAAELHDRIVERLSAADVAAEVDTSKAHEVSLRVDAASAGDVGRLLLWRGGVTVAVVDDEAEASLLRVSGATREEVAEALSRLKPPAGYVFAIEPLATGLAKSHALEWPAIAEVDTVRAIADGPRVLVPASPELEAAVLALAASRPAAVLAITRGRTVLATVPVAEVLDHDRLVIPFGASITAYTEASDVAHLLATDPLPPLRELSHAPLPRDWLLATANVVLPLLVSFAWLFFVRQFDRAQPEPLWLVIATFALGALAVLPAGLLEWGWDALSPYTNPTLLTFGRAPRAFPLALVGFVVTVGLSEEGMKLLATWSLARHRHEFDEPVDGIVYGAAAALGFAAAENIRYLALGRVDGPLVASRAFMSVPAHLFFGALWGYALGRRLVRPDKKVWPLFLAAAGLHGLFDTCLSIDGAGIWAFVVSFFVASLFLVHLRSALRYGPVGVTGTAAERGARELFAMGSRGVFASYVVIVYVFSSLIFVLALFGHDGRAGVAFGIPFGIASTFALAILGWGARGIAASLPLDAVVDDVGVTFAGAAMAYPDVLRVEPRKRQLVLHAANRTLTVGPANPAIIEALVRAFEHRRAQPPTPSPAP